MDSKTDPKLCKNHLLAIVALLGIDEAIAMLQAERERVVAVINGNREKFRELNDHLGQPTKVLEVKSPTKARMISTLKSLLHSGPRSIHRILINLEGLGLIPNVTNETRRGVEKILRDKTFSIRSNGVYMITHPVGSVRRGPVLLAEPPT